VSAVAVPDAGEALRPEVVRDVEQALSVAPLDFGGGASPFKGAVLAQLIVEHRARTIVEIGVLHGRGALALCVGAQAVPGAHVWGVDPYDVGSYRDPAQGHALGDEIAGWLATFDFEAACRGMLDRIRAAGMEQVFTLLRRPSLEGAQHFPLASIDLLHIDGDHGREAVEADVEAWLPRVRPNGLVVFDDVSWPTIAPVAAAVRPRCETVFELADSQGLAGRGVNDFAVLRLRDPA
jgi:predicted O-methyltransferase YrrM